ncbi:MAG TPA: hypothetical protein VN667_04835 [Burkholderiales bacterium]|nr:hypothetical protein [Burkholderiales bacterium]
MYAGSANGSAPLPTLFVHNEVEEAVVVRKQQEEEYPFITIQKFSPRIAKAIELMWGNPELETYFDKLIVDDRGGRAGFPRPVMDALLKLYNDHTKRFNFKKVPDFFAHDPLAAAKHWGISVRQ